VYIVCVFIYQLFGSLNNSDTYFSIRCFATFSHLEHECVVSVKRDLLNATLNNLFLNAEVVLLVIILFLETFDSSLIEYCSWNVEGRLIKYAISDVLPVAILALEGTDLKRNIFMNNFGSLLQVSH